MIEVTFRIPEVQTVPPVHEVAESISQVCAGTVLVTSIRKIDDDTPERNLPA